MTLSHPKRAAKAAPRPARDGALDALAHLRRATRDAHTALEARSPLLRDDVTVHAYQAYLHQIAPLIACTEAFAVGCAQALGAVNYDFAGVRRHTRLLADLDPQAAPAAGGPTAAARSVAYARALARHNTLGGRLGVLYVLEGSTLGGQVLCRRLQRLLGLRPQQMRYLAGHGRATGARWRATCVLLNAVLRTAARRREACAAATTTFELFLRALTVGG